MDPWQVVLTRAWGHATRPGAGTQLFRGHSDPEWKLLPSMARPAWQSTKDQEDTEYNGYFGFVTAGASLLPTGADAWTVAFAMQHHGLPTRLLDWTHNFAVALYFALRSPEGDTAIWILDPYELNQRSIGKDLLLHPTQLSTDYRQYFIDRTAPPDGDVVSIVPLRHHPRVISQQSAFTLHADLETPLEELHPNCVTKIVIPHAVRKDADIFLHLAGVTELTLSPDLDALARLMKTKFQR
jgi:hypothetical protein